MPDRRLGARYEHIYKGPLHSADTVNLTEGPKVCVEHMVYIVKVCESGPYIKYLVTNNL